MSVSLSLLHSLSFYLSLLSHATTLCLSFLSSSTNLMHATTIAVADSGLDTNSCFFYDPQATVDFTRDPHAPPAATPEGSRSHRKVARYWEFMDRMEIDRGHGTHVAGSVAGDASPHGPLQEHNGMAPGARLLFTDLGCASEGGCKCPPGVSCECDSKVDGLCKQSFTSLYLPS